MFKKLTAFFILLILLLFPSVCFSLDKGHFKGLEDEDIGYVLTAFQDVDVHYFLSPSKGNIFFGPIDGDPKISIPVKRGLVLYFNPLVCEQMRKKLDSKYGDLVTKSAKASLIIKAQFARRNEPSSDDPGNPNFIILHNYLPKMDVFEYFATSDNKPFLMKSKEGPRVIPAFIDRDEAIKRQSFLAEKGINVDRIGLDERSFIKFIVSEGKKGNYTLVEGF